MSRTSPLAMLIRRDAAGRAARAKVRNFVRCLAVAARHGLPASYAYFGESIGDDLLSTAVLRAMADRGMPRPWFGTNHPQLFVGNGDVERLVPFSAQFGYLLRRLGRRVHGLGYATPSDDDRATPPPREHLLAMMARRAGLAGAIDVKPIFRLTNAEAKAGRVVDRQVAIMSGGMSARMPMLNKQWPPERYQQVVDAMRDSFNVVQVGVAGDPPLAGVTNLCGRTSLRQTAAVLANSLCFVGGVGFLMHLARAVDCRSVIVFGGREAPWQSGYVANENLYRAVPCAPCWLINRCDYDRRCLKEITADDVVAAVERQVARVGEPLQVERLNLDSSPATRVDAPEMLSQQP